MYNKLLMNNKLSIIGTVGLPPKLGGFETFADFLVKKLNKKFEITVFCSSKYYSVRDKRYLSAKRIFIPLKANGIQSVPYDIISIIISLFIADTLLILGVSGSIVLPFLKPFHKKNIIVSIDGLEWKRDKWSKFAKWFLKLSEYCAVKYANKVVADNPVIQGYIKTKYNKESTLIEYGGDQSITVKPTVKNIQHFSFLKDQYALSISRIEPENNCDLILEAFSELSSLNLVYIGTWNNSKYGKELKKKYEDYKNIFIYDAIYDINILNLIRSNCTIYIHGHSVGGTNPGLVEAMYVGLPILTYDINFNRETTHNKALYFNDIKELKNNVESLLNDHLLRVQLSEDVRKVAKVKYSWDKIIKKYEDII